jgi:hypothetical protein
MSQRGITKLMLEKVLELGEAVSDEKIVLNKKIGLRLLKELDAARKDLLKIIDKGGIALVLEGDSLITTYNYNSYRREAR